MDNYKGKTDVLKISSSIEKNVVFLDEKLAVDKSFDIVSRPIVVGGRRGQIYFIDGMCKDELMQKLLEFLMELDSGECPDNAVTLAGQFLPTIEMELQDEWEEIEKNLLSGVFCLFID